MAFHTIEPNPQLDGPARRRAHRVGPPAVAVRTGYASLLRSAGFVEVGVEDLTPEYLATVRRWIAAREENFDALAVVLGAADVRERIRNGRNTARAIEDGLLTRTQYLAYRPAHR